MHLMRAALNDIMDLVVLTPACTVDEVYQSVQSPRDFQLSLPSACST